jgi:glycosyltransferase involved in cell wall biosynthesis
MKRLSREHSRMTYQKQIKPQNNDYLVSIITVVFNGEKYIEDTINSIINQDYDNIEYIIIDGGSTDNSINIIRKYDKYVSIFLSEQDRGMYDAINKGLRLANGEIVAYLNADDQYLPYTIKEVVKTFKSKPHLDYLYGNCIYIDNKKRQLYEYKSIPYIRLFVKNMNEIHWAQPSCFWKKQVHTKLGYFDDNLRYCGDYDFFSRLKLGNFNGSRINIPLSLFMLHDDALSNKSHLALTAEHKSLCSKYKPKHNLFWGCLGEVTFKIINIKAIINKYFVIHSAPFL